MRIGNLLLLLAILLPLSSYAHKPSDSYLFLSEGGAPDSLNLRWDIALRDLEAVLALDQDRDRKITWKELKVQQREVFNYALNDLSIHQESTRCLVTTKTLQVNKHSDGGYAVLNVAYVCAEPIGGVVLNYTLFAEIDPTHRGILMDQREGSRTGPFILGPEKNRLKLDVLSEPAGANPVIELIIRYIVEGIWHIWIGVDHILFIMVLILPFVMLTAQNSSPRMLVGIISAFTLAHSLTLSVAVLGWVSLPSRWVETAIALSIIFTAWNNLSRKFHLGRWKLAFAFGLLHGFGFAAVLLDLGLPSQSIAYSLLGFNLGVEIGQLVILLCVFPLPLILQQRHPLRLWCLRHGSLMAIAIATLWCVERSLNVELALYQFAGFSVLIYILIQYLHRRSLKIRSQKPLPVL